MVDHHYYYDDDDDDHTQTTHIKAIDSLDVYKIYFKEIPLC